MAQWTTPEAWINDQRVSILDLRKWVGVYKNGFGIHGDAEVKRRGRRQVRKESIPPFSNSN